MITKCDHWKNSIPHHYDSVYLTWLNPVLSWLKITTGFCFFSVLNFMDGFFQWNPSLGGTFLWKKNYGFFFRNAQTTKPPKRLPPDISRMDRISDRASAALVAVLTSRELPARSILKNVWFVYMYMYLNRYIYIYIVIFGFYRYMNYIHMYI